ncbi:MAG: NADH-quinone oxidoreductase subunit NuoF [Eubacteriales bacterium]
MNRISSQEFLLKASEEYKKALDLQTTKVLICAGTGCVAGGSMDIYNKIVTDLKNSGINVTVELGHNLEEESVSVKQSGCHGFCEMGPLVRIEPQGWLYIKVKLEDCEEIIQKTIIESEPIERLMYNKDGETFMRQEDIPFYKKQTRLVLEHCGHNDAESIEEYIAGGGYKAVAKCLFELTPMEIIEEIRESSLRGRGGGGFPAAIKWEQVNRQAEPVKYIVCNGDEGDPGAFMDRSIMEGDPHKVIEGMIIAGIATGAHDGYLYVRAEYPLAVNRLKIAIKKAEEAGLLGDDILGSGFSFKLHINQGAGAFVCGEGSALTASIEGNRGMPRVKPPRTVEQGLFGKPTVLNNVETFANVTVIMNIGAAEYVKLGPPKNHGTKAFALTGNVKNTGLIEVPMGTTLREVIYDIGGGIKNDKKFKAVQIGGPSGGCLITPHLDITLDFDSLGSVGAMIGSGGLVVMDEDTCMVEIARFFMNFTQNESCGKCVPCREGTKVMLRILEDIVAGRGKVEDLDTLLELADTISTTALCGLGKTAPSPVVSTITHFRDEYLAHIVDKKCPTKVCQALKQFEIDPDKCKGCSKCARICPVGAISGKIKEPYIIDKTKCIKCGACIDSCSFSAVKEV